MRIKLFKINDEGVLSINSPELLSVASFKELINRDANINKVLAFKELAYVWFAADYDSPVVLKGLKGKSARDFIISKTEMPTGWYPDSIVDKAIQDYKDMQEDVGRELVGEIVSVFSGYSKVVSKVRKSIDFLLSVDAGLTKAQAEELVSLMDTVLNISKHVPLQIKNLKEVLAELQKDTTAEDRDYLRGTEAVVPDSADPSRDY